VPADIFWCSAFLDFTPAAFEAGGQFWAEVTGYRVSPFRGEQNQFATLLPPVGDSFLRVQRLGAGPSRVHLDLHVPDPTASARTAVELGATIAFAAPDDYVVLTSPAGLTFCFVTHSAGHRPPPTRWGEHSSLVDQVCLDVPAADADRETEFWATLTGWAPRSSSAPQFRPLQRPAGMPLRLMIQIVGDDRQPATAHLDLACDDRAAETERHQVLGAAVRTVAEHYTVLTDPAGSAYCITDRDPVTGLLPR
jgi:hypothetical protein